MNIGFLVFPGVTLLDMAGALEPLALLPDTKIHLIWKTTAPITTDKGQTLVPSVSFTDCPALEVICIPGGMGQTPHVFDPQVQEFLKDKGKHAKWIASVCTGSFFLAAAGLLDGYQSTCHWAFKYHLRDFGVEVVNKRLVIDRNRISVGGVSAGIDLGIALAAKLAGETAARVVQLTIEYDPQPPFDCGSPLRATQEDVAEVCELLSSDLPENFSVNPELAIAANRD
jgi:cyclohexyl-isocyanide hydratase